MHQSGELLKELLLKCGLKNDQEINAFLNPDYDRDLHDPFLMRDMERACVRLYQAIDNNEKIIIYADYDCDGIPGAVILSDLLKKINYKNYEVYIPQRNSEGYGLNLIAIGKFIKSGVQLIITIDLGITAVEEVAEASIAGIDVIITDHHLPHETLPRAFAILNPKVDDYPEKMLCGSGVMFKFVQGFVKKYGEFFKITNGWEKWSLDMAGLATLSDMVPLTGENRAIAYFGMKVLRKSPRPGLQKLLAKMNIDQKYLSEDDVGFMLTPRINAASRMDDPMRAFELLSTIDEVEGDNLAIHLSKINDERKNIVKGIMRDVGKTFSNSPLREMNEVIVVGNPNWRVGVLGLVAGKIMDEYNKPVFVWGKDENDCIKGSCRSPGSVSIVELMTETKEFFLDFGGHELAGGFTVHTEKVHFLEEALSLSFKKLTPSAFGTSPYVGGGTMGVNFDIKFTLNAVNMKNWREIEKMTPFGLANPKPIFLFENVKIEKLKKFGKNGSGEHLEIIFSNKNQEGDENTNTKVVAISFFSGLDSFSKVLEEGINVNLLATFDLSRFRGKEELRLRIEDIY